MISSPTISYCTNSLLYVNLILGLPRFVAMIAAYLSPVACPASPVCFLAIKELQVSRL